MIRTTRVVTPNTGIPDQPGDVGDIAHQERLSLLEERMRTSGLDAAVIYADREHSGHLDFLTGVDPRFEEALLIVTAEGGRTLLLGNECMALAPPRELGITVQLFQDFSPGGQPRGESTPLPALLRSAGIESGMRVGCAGWKTYTPSLVGVESAIELPAYLVELIVSLVGNRRLVTAANDIFLDPQQGLRTSIAPCELERFEYAATVAAAGIRTAGASLRAGVLENEVESYFLPHGLPLSCHSMVSFGDKARRTLSSPSASPLSIGDPFHLAFGLRGALGCRAGMAIDSLAQLDSEVAEFYEAFARNYWHVVRTWYASVGIGVSGGAVFEAVEAVRDNTLFDFALNPGHLLHHEEWSTSIFSAGGVNVLRSGTPLQCDIIPVSRGPFVMANAEDGVVLADEDFREEVRSRYPEMWQRIQTRIRFMEQTLGIPLDPSVLPLSDLCGWFAPLGLRSEESFVWS